MFEVIFDIRMSILIDKLGLHELYNYMIISELRINK